MSNFYNAICYDAMPAPYNPSTANNTCIFFGSDVAYKPMEPLWGKSYTSTTGSSCPNGRDDLATIKSMGVELIRLYDWEPRNIHIDFLDYCVELGIKVLAPVSNYFLLDGFASRDTLIPNLIKSFSNAAGTDYHPAIAGIIIGNEPRLNGFTAQTCVDFTLSWVNIENSQFSGYSMPIIGHPVDFNQYGGEYPCWGFWQPLLQQLDNVNTRNLENRLFLAPQTYNDGNYLYHDVGTGTGYVDLTWNQFQKPMLFTEIGQDRTKPNYLQVIKDQLSGAIAYDKAKPNILLGTCHFQFADKVWMEGTSEGSFGTFSHSNNISCTVTYGNGDFTHWDNGSCAGNQLNVDVLTQNPSFAVVQNIYKAPTGGLGSLPPTMVRHLAKSVTGNSLDEINSKLALQGYDATDIISIQFDEHYTAFYKSKN
jgi:hypothetical protein